MYCKNCGHYLDDNSRFCPNCGKSVQSGPKPYTGHFVDTSFENKNEESKLNRLAALLFCLFLGGLGVHRFYAGKVGTGILWLLTAGCFGIGILVDFIMIACGVFTDSNGKVIKNWNV